MAKQETKAQRCAALMPRLRHHVKGEQFDTFSSDVIEWLVAQPEIRDMVFTYCKDKGSIVFDESSGTWCGKDSNDTH
jgi:hypothetical protein